MKKSKHCEPGYEPGCEPQKEYSVVSIMFSVLSGIAAFVALYYPSLYATETSIHQIYVVTSQIKYVLWAILFMCGALYWKK